MRRLPSQHQRPPATYSIAPRSWLEDEMPAQLALATEIGWLQRAVIEKLRTRPASVLDLGCGSRRPFGILADTIVGIDSDERALRANRSLTSAICADLTEFDLGSNAYDVIVCWNVLEHVREPAPVLARMARALRSGGVLVLAFPNVGSARGLLTRFTPTFVHRAALRHVLGGRNSDPYPTKLRGDHHPRRILENARGEHLVPIHVRLYEGYYERRLRELRPTLYELWTSAVRLLGWASFGRVDSRTDVLMAFEKLHNSHALGQPPHSWRMSGDRVQ